MDTCVAKTYPSVRGGQTHLFLGSSVVRVHRLQEVVGKHLVREQTGLNAHGERMVLLLSTREQVIQLLQEV